MMAKVIAIFQNWLQRHGISPSQISITFDVLTESGAFRLAQEIEREFHDQIDSVRRKIGPVCYDLLIMGMKVKVRKQESASRDNGS